MNFWHEAFRWFHPRGDLVDYDRLTDDLIWSLGLTGLFLAAGLIIFRRRDLTS
jgi:hypothetical protein